MAGARRPRGYANNPELSGAGARANSRRAAEAGRRQAHVAREALAVLRAGGGRQQWLNALELRVARPDSSMGELGAAMTPPMTKDAYAALLRRAVRAADAARAGESTAPRAGHQDTEAIRVVLGELLSSGRFITTSELRIRLGDHGFPGLAHETVYRQLRVLAGRGLIRRVGGAGHGRDVRWTSRGSWSGSGVRR
ncbi:helix-turn-helix domain-containing protein [Mycobacterium servetii]|uniref:Helix-turn-helix domain-containing protein n=1 Tax=Mycobacterium servetii TaxID=3237418 RepID=A0ABV4C9C3_9MYCO